MSTWTEEELRTFVENDDLYISPFRTDGVTYGTPTRIWSVVVDDQLYVRPARGPQSSWYQAAMTERAGRIRVGDRELDVTFAPAGEDILDAVDSAYENGYVDSSAVAVMVGHGPRSATIQVGRR